MQWGSILLCGWPGLARLWYRGSWSGLALAIGFSLLLNVALLVSFVWPWLFGELFPLIVWPCLALVWTVSARMAYQNLPDLMSVTNSEPEVPDAVDPTATLFNQAQSEYLKGHWDESESLLLRRLSRHPRDIEARLLLASLYRHSHRWNDARQSLQDLSRFDESTRWLNEIGRELELIDRDDDQRPDELATEEITGPHRIDEQPAPRAQAG